ncbi:MAG: biopolymer transporter ExbD [Planctomycetota bacterium]|nr:biopolymer transporter ExbD [Planctomycetota bacterium]
MARKKAELEEVELELTPMIDVTFLLLIFFICTMKFKVLEGKLVTNLPKDVGVNSSPVDDILEKVEIDIVSDPSRADGFKVAINSQVLPDLDTFTQRIAAFVAQDEDTRATLYPRDGVNYEQVVKVVDRCLTARLQDITFAGVAYEQ